MKKKIKAWVRKWLEEEQDSWTPKKSRDLRAVSFTSKQPTGRDKYQEYLFQCTEWDNGEGFDISINFHYDKTNTDKTISLCYAEIDGILACLNYMGKFEL